MLGMFDDPFSASDVAKEIKSASALKALIDKVPVNRFTATSLREPEYPDYYGTLELHHCDIVELLVEMIEEPRFQGHWQFEPVLDVREGKRYYSDYVTGKHFEHMYNVVIRDGQHSGTALCAVGMVSDATCISLTSGMSVHPVYVFPFNLSPDVRWKKGGIRLAGLMPKVLGTPGQMKREQHKKDRLRVFHAGLSLLVKSLESKGNGVFCKLQLPSQAERRLVFFHLAVYLGDNPEMSKVCLVYEGVKAQVPCNNCFCPSDRLHETELVYPRRNKKHAISLQRQMAVMVNDTTRGNVTRLEAFSKKWSMHPGIPFWLHTPFCDPYKIPPERLHFMDAGIIAWVISALVCMIRVLFKGAEQNAKIRELDRRFQSIPKFPGLRVFTQGVSTCCKYTAVEWVSMLKVLVCVVPGLFPPELQVTQLCVKLSVMYMDMRRSDINEDQMQTARENAIAFKDQALFSLAPVLDKVSKGDIYHMSTCKYLHLNMYNSMMTY
jgi:hypothetical protein